jgi:lipid-binding SYLF domain-containing protein
MLKQSILAVMMIACVARAAERRDDSRTREAAERIDAASVVLHEIMSAPDKGIPKWALDRASCAVIVPSVKKGAFFVGVQYGKGVVLCRKQGGGWTAPSTVRIEGGSFGLQFGGGAVDAVILVMNEQGRKQLARGKFTLGAEAGAMAGPVGRTTKAETDVFMRAKFLSYSRSRGVFAGVAVEGGTLRADARDNQAVYGRPVTQQQILSGQVLPTMPSRSLIAMLGKHSPREK